MAELRIEKSADRSDGMVLLSGLHRGSHGRMNDDTSHAPQVSNPLGGVRRVGHEGAVRVDPRHIDDSTFEPSLHPGQRSGQTRGDRQHCDTGASDDANHPLTTRGRQTRKMHVVETGSSEVASTTEVRAIHENIEVGARLASFVVVDHLAPLASAQIDTKSSPGCFEVDRFWSEQRHSMSRLQHLGDGRAHLFAASIGGPVEVVDRDIAHLDTSHFMSEPREMRRFIIQRSRSIAGRRVR